MSFQNMYMHSRIQALENTMQQVCSHLDYLQYTIPTAYAASSLLNTDILPPVFSDCSNVVSLFSFVLFVMFIGLLLFKMFKCLSKQCAVQTLVIETEILEDLDDMKEKENDDKKDSQKQDDTEKVIEDTETVNL